MGGEDQPFPHLVRAAVFLVKVEGRREAVGFVEMPDFGIDPELIEQPRAARAEYEVLGDAAQRVVVVEAVRNRSGKSVVFLDVGG